MITDPFAAPVVAAHLAAMPADLAGRDTGQMSRADYGRYQRYMAQIGQATGQCPECWAYRLDGRPPTLHVPGAACADQDGNPIGAR